MKRENLKQAVDLARKLKHVFVATSDKNGLPHMAAAGKLTLGPEGRVVVAAWFCPTTVANLHRNRQVALIVWDPIPDTGYQLLGVAEEVEDVAMLNGYTPDKSPSPLPQVERQILMRVDRIIDFKHAPHSDREE